MTSPGRRAPKRMYCYREGPACPSTCLSHNGTPWSAHTSPSSRTNRLSAGFRCQFEGPKEHKPGTLSASTGIKHCKSCSCVVHETCTPRFIFTWLIATRVGQWHRPLQLPLQYHCMAQRNPTITRNIEKQHGPPRGPSFGGRASIQKGH